MSFAEKTAATDASPDLNSSIYRRVGVHVHVHLPSRQDAHAQVPWRHIVEGADWRVGVASDYVKKAEGIMNGRDVRDLVPVSYFVDVHSSRRAARQVVGRNMEVFRSIFMFKKIKVKGGCRGIKPSMIKAAPRTRRGWRHSYWRRCCAPQQVISPPGGRTRRSRRAAAGTGEPRR